MSYILTYYDHSKIDIPNINNALEGMFADLKIKLWNHLGLSKVHREKFIDEYF